MDQLIDNYQVDFTKVPRQANLGGVIVESRCHAYLPLVVKNFVHMLPTWALTIFHVASNKSYIEDFLGPNHSVRLVQLNQPDLTINSYNQLLMSKEFYEQIPYEQFLIFQCDSYLRSGQIEPFLSYDYVGALWNHWEAVFGPRGKVLVGNGGLSLRRKQTMLAILDLKVMKAHRHLPEDVFFSLGMDYLPHANRCPPHIAGTFSVEAIYHPDPLGWHQAYKFHRGQDWDNLKKPRMTINGSNC